MSAQTPKQLAALVLAEALGVPVARPSTTKAAQALSDAVNGRAALPKPGTAAAQLAAALATDERSTERVTRSPSDEMRDVIEDVLRTMYSRGELK